MTLYFENSRKSLIIRLTSGGDFHDRQRGLIHIGGYIADLSERGWEANKAKQTQDT